MKLPDEKDRHVLAAAIKSNAKFIITFNLRYFSTHNLRAYNIQAMHPDSFLKELLQTDYQKVCQAAERQRQRLKNPPKTIDEYLSTLEQKGLPQSAALMRQLCYQN